MKIFNKLEVKKINAPKQEFKGAFENFVVFTVRENKAGRVAMGKFEDIYFIAYTDEAVNNFVKALYTVTKSYKDKELDSYIYNDFVDNLQKKIINKKGEKSEK